MADIMTSGISFMCVHDWVTPVVSLVIVFGAIGLLVWHVGRVSR